MKRIFICLVLLSTMPTGNASGLFFNLTATGDPANASITLCLNAKGELTCQNDTANALNLKILTTPNHQYDVAGIRSNSPFYSVDPATSNCTPLKNGFCMFTVSNTSPAYINLKGPDYIVVGVGTAGAVLANRLSAGNQNRVVALHNGPNLNRDPLIALSKNAIFTVFSALIGPPLYAIAETTAQIDIHNRILNWVYALPLGGASSVNAGAWCRATNQVNAQWEAIAGPNWSVANIQNTYVALEKYNGLTNNPGARGFNGPLPIRQDPTPNTVSLTFTQAIMNATGVPFVLDYNDPDTPIGASSQVQYTQMGPNGALRSSSATTFLNATVMDKNGNGVNGRKLHVLFDVTADNVIWNGTKAVGVNYYENGVRKSLYAGKGIVVSAGIKSSSFLMRSGVGPQSLLQSLNIPVVYDNPNVGSGLADQQRMTLVYLTDPEDSPAPLLQRLSGKIISAFAQTSLGQEIISKIGTQIAVQNGLFSQIAWLPAPAGDPSVRALRFASVNLLPGITLVLFDLVQPKSRGSIAITSRDPFEEPAMNMGILSNSDDLDLYLDGFQTYISSINAQLPPSYEMVVPDPAILGNVSLLTDFIRQQIATNMHFQSHCRMAPLVDGGVVDSTGHVYGVQNLLVADDSIVPVNMDGSPMATAYLVAEIVANLLLF